MAFADTYFKRFQSDTIQIAKKPQNDLFLIIVIPSYNEDELCKSLQSISNCVLPHKSAEVIVVINSSEDTSAEIKEKNRETYNKALAFAEKNNTSKLNFFILNKENLPRKFAGVGLARKIGTDEALHRFNYLNNPSGLIAGFDADALLKNNYLTEIETYFNRNPKTNAATINFEHPIAGTGFSKEIYRNIINYELHLRYFIEALRFVKFPFAYHTIGSSFVVRADIYAKQGGMNRKKAGEDFYFLQKIIPLGNYGEINTTTVIPSPRLSDRVPFGTGAAVSKMIENDTDDFGTYNFDVFILLKTFFEKTVEFYKNSDYSDFSQIIAEFLDINNFKTDLIKIKNNSPNITIFKKRFFDWFNAFRVIKFLNFAHEKYFSRQKVKNESVKLLKIYHNEINMPDNEKDLLLLYRKIQKKTSYKI
ncbi:MAG: glycosyltransferase family 2 protein [Bacteroidales bacterium]|nr:glycosyltransferase family 2 protein [Bacteroidales bacterium]